MIIGDSASRVIAGRLDVIAEPTPRIPGRTPALYLHSAASDAREAAGWSLPAVRTFTKCAVDDCGLAIVAPTCLTATPTWSFGAAGLPAGAAVGLAAFRGNTDAAIAAHNALFGSSGHVGLGGTSMGTTNALIHALEHPGTVDWMVLFSPVFDLVGYYAANTGGNTAAIAAGWGINNGDPLPAKADIYARRAELAGIPTLFIESSDDGYSAAYGDGSKYAAFIAAVGGTRMALGAVGHGNGTVAAADYAVIRDFINAHS